LVVTGVLSGSSLGCGRRRRGYPCRWWTPGPRSTMGARAGRHRPPGGAVSAPHRHHRSGWAARPTATRGRGVATYAVRLLTRPSAV